MSVTDHHQHLMIECSAFRQPLRERGKIRDADVHEVFADGHEEKCHKLADKFQSLNWSVSRRGELFEG